MMPEGDTFVVNSIHLVFFYRIKCKLIAVEIVTGGLCIAFR